MTSGQFIVIFLKTSSVPFFSVKGVILDCFHPAHNKITDSKSEVRIK